jgi:acyl-CoA thioester hydrolase
MNMEPSPFELAILVEPADIDELGHVNNVAYLRWVQDVAVVHWRAIASAEDQSKLWWVVVRHEIDYKHPSYLGDGIIAKTWVGTASRIRFERHTELLRASDRCLLAGAHPRGRVQKPDPAASRAWCAARRHRAAGGVSATDRRASARPASPESLRHSR